MAYKITLRIAQQSNDRFDVVEKTCWHYANGNEWTETQGCHVLSMGGSGTSGMLRFKSRSGEAFCLVMGVHNHKRWCDVVVHLDDETTTKSIHAYYYRPGGDPMLWKQLSEITKTSARGMKFKLEFTEKEGTELSATLTLFKPLNLLSLDGGGVRGLSALLSLAMLMRSLNQGRQEEDHVKPCDVFDLIGGTGTGGLIAIMLGRLRMRVNDCIDKYIWLMENIWQRKSNGNFDSSVLQETMAALDVENGNADFYVNSDPICRAFVCAKAQELDVPVRLCSYKHPLYAAAPTISQVASATCATSGLFKAVSVGSRKYVDGGLGFNNPVHEVWSEAMNIWCPDPEISELEPMIQCFVSIGSGNPGLQPINDDDLSKTTMKIVQDTESEARKFLDRERRLFRQKRYFRFNVQQGLQDVGFNEYMKRGEIETATEYYLNNVERTFMIRDCVERISGSKVI